VVSNQEYENWIAREHFNSCAATGVVEFEDSDGNWKRIPDDFSLSTNDVDSFFYLSEIRGVPARIRRTHG